ncbi:MAG: RodZ domain-containing protein [Desulfuromonadaceae bacterium]
MNGNRFKGPVSSLPETGSGSPGSILRRCREFHDISLEEASETTKIGITHLKALEDDRISEFANQAYLKGFLRIYATYLGLNSEDIARMYAKLFGTQGDKTDPAGISPPGNRPKRSLISLKKLIFPAVLLLLILITATYFKRPPPPLVRRPQPPAIVVPPLQNAAIQSVQSSVRNERRTVGIAVPKVEKQPPERITVEKSPPSERPAVAANGFILKIKVTQNGTLMVTVDDSSAQPYELTTGDVIEWKAEKKVALELSNAGRIDIELNGKPYKSLGASGKPVYVEIDTNAVVQ